MPGCTSAPFFFFFLVHIYLLPVVFLTWWWWTCCLLNTSSQRAKSLGPRDVLSRHVLSRRVLSRRVLLLQNLWVERAPFRSMRPFVFFLFWSGMSEWMNRRKRFLSLPLNLYKFNKQVCRAASASGAFFLCRSLCRDLPWSDPVHRSQRVRFLMAALVQLWKWHKLFKSYTSGLPSCMQPCLG